MSTSPRINRKQALFVAEYLKCLNASEAARRAGYSAKTAMHIGFQLLQKTPVAAAIAEAQRERMERLKLDADGLVQIWSTITTADTNEVVQYRRNCCRYCWGLDFNYQFTPAEFRDAQIRFEERRASILAGGGNDIGDFPSFEGDWYDKRKRPNPECPECFGDGLGETYIVDTRDLTEAGRALFAGVKEGRDGIEVKLHDQQTAAEKLGRSLGVFRDRDAAGGQTGVLETELAMRYVELMEKSREMQRRTLAERGLDNGEDN